MWQANVTIKNNTGYNLTVDGVGPGNTTIGPNSETSWSSEEVHNTNPKFGLMNNISIGNKFNLQ